MQRRPRLVFSKNVIYLASRLPLPRGIASVTPNLWMSLITCRQNAWQAKHVVTMPHLLQIGSSTQLEDYSTHRLPPEQGT